MPTLVPLTLSIKMWIKRITSSLFLRFHLTRMAILLTQRALTNNTRNSTFMRRAEGEPIAPGGGGWAISKFDVTSNENTISIFKDRVNGKFKIKTMIVATGTEQVALDCEKFIQQSHEHRPGKMWSNTGGGERIGIREGNYGTDVTISTSRTRIQSFS